MKKKLFATLGALCLGVILCVSSVFAVNWWYGINNTGANDQTITFGQKINLSLANDEGAATGVYQGSVITFKTFTVNTQNWTAKGGDIHTSRPDMPTFKLVIDADSAITSVMDLDIVIKDDESQVVDDANYTTSAATNGGIVVENIQAIGETFTVTVTATVKDDLPSTLAGTTITFSAEIVVGDTWAGDTNLGDE